MIFNSLFCLRCLLVVVLSCVAKLKCSANSDDVGDACKPSHCSSGKLHCPEIRFPFRIKDSSSINYMHESCGYPGFDVSCKGPNTYIDLPFFVNGTSTKLELVVKYINYIAQKLIVADPGDCLAGLLISSNTPNYFSASPFNTPNYSYDQIYRWPEYYNSNYTLVACSKNIQVDLYPISCLSNSTHAVFAAYSFVELDSLPVSCQPSGKTLLLGIYSPMELALSWDLPGCIKCERTGGQCRPLALPFSAQNTTNEHPALTCRVMSTAMNPNRWRRNVIIIGASTGSVFLLLLLIMIIFSIKFYYSSKLNKTLDLENEIMVKKFLEEYESLHPSRYSFADLRRMTNQFKDKLGQGGFGSVYEGRLPNGTCVAVKILHSFGVDGKEFMNEVATMGRIHHVNVVRLLGFCSDRLKRALVYEFMPNESLEKFIFSKNDNSHQFLGWEKLQDIAVGIARGIEYLHQGCDQRILHFDIKPHNILLDQNFDPKISDFGMAKLCSKERSVVSMTAARGTMGYMAPEVLSRNFGNVSHKSDVYSFGMLLLEMVGGRKNIDTTVDKTSQVYFPEWIYKRLCQDEEMDLDTPTDEDAKIVRKLTIVALWCIQWQPADRPSMTGVVHMLEGSIAGLAIPPDPFISTTTTSKTDLEGKCDQITCNLATILE